MLGGLNLPRSSRGCSSHAVASSPLEAEAEAEAEAQHTFAAAVSSVHSASASAASAEYLRTIAAELNDVGTEAHALLLSSSLEDAAGDDFASSFDTAMGLYKEAASTMMESVDAAANCGGMDVDPSSAEILEHRAKRRMEMIVATKEMLMDRREASDSLAASTTPAAPLRDMMLFDPDSACDAGPLRLTAPISSRSLDEDGFGSDGGIALAYSLPYDEDRVGSATLCNIGLLQLRRACPPASSADPRAQDPALLDSALRFFRMSLTASEEVPVGSRACVGGVDRITSLCNLGYGLYKKGMCAEAAAFFRDAVDEMDAADAERKAMERKAEADRYEAMRMLGGAMDLESNRGRSRYSSHSTPGLQSCLKNAGEGGNFASLASASTTPSTTSPWRQHARIVLTLNVARSLHACGRIEEAFDASVDALELCVSAQEEAEAELKAKAGQANAEGDDSERDLRQLQDSGKLHPEIASASVALLYNLGVQYEAQGVKGRAQQCYRQFVEKVGEMSAEHTAEITAATTRALLLELQDQDSSSGSAEQDDLVRVLSHLRDARSAFGHDHPNLSAALRCVGSSLGDREDHERALPFLLESVRIKKAEAKAASSNMSNKNKGKSDEQEVQMPPGADSIVALNALGECYHGLGKLEEARKCYDEVRRAFKSTGPSGLKRALKEARQASIRAEKDTTGATSPPSCTVSSIRFIFAVTLYNGGRVLFELGRREESAGYFGDALSLAETVVKCASSSPRIRVDRHRDDPEGARNHLLECASLMHNVGQYEAELGRTTAALRCLTSALDVRKESLAEHPAQLAEASETLYQLGGLKRKVGDEEGAWECYAECLRVESPETNPGRVAAVLHRMAQIRYELREPERALELFRSALGVVMEKEARKAAAQNSTVGEGQVPEDEDAPTAADVLGWIGTVQGEMGLIDEARSSFAASQRAAEEEQLATSPSSSGQSVASRTSPSATFSSMKDGLPASAYAEMLEGRPAAAA